MTALRQFVRRVLHRAGLIQLYFRAVEWRLSRGREKPPQTDENGVPLPPLHLIALTVAHADWRMYLQTGEATAKALDQLAAASGLPFSAANRILDFGCGAGRVIRHLPAMTQASLYGVDYNAVLADWCDVNLPGDFARNALTPPLDYPDGHFDIVYALSVFTHLREDTQRKWLAEYARILRPGGLALISFHEETQPGFPQTQQARRAIETNGVYVYNDMVEGSNLIATFQTQDHARGLFAEMFEVAAMRPRDDAVIGQSLAILRRSSGS